jgi:hypothetical protein
MNASASPAVYGTGIGGSHRLISASLQQRTREDVSDGRQQRRRRRSVASSGSGYASVIAQA